jgi:hypothetical protein
LLAHVAARRLDRRTCLSQLERVAALVRPAAGGRLHVGVADLMRAWLRGDLDGGLQSAREQSATGSLADGVQQAAAQPLRNRDHLVNLSLGYALRFALAAEADDLCELLLEQVAALPAFFRSPDLSLFRAVYLQRRGRDSEARRILEASARADPMASLAREALAWLGSPSSVEPSSVMPSYLAAVPPCDTQLAYLSASVPALGGLEDPVTDLIVRCLPRFAGQSDRRGGPAAPEQH